MIVVKVAASREVILGYDVFNLFSLIPKCVSDIITEHEREFDSHVPEYKMEEKLQGKLSTDFDKLYASVYYARGRIVVMLTTSVCSEEPTFH